jgi:hypothetical protein
MADNIDYPNGTADIPEEALASLERQAIENKRLSHGKRGGGLQAFQPTDSERKQVAYMAGMGLRFDQIACLVRDGVGKGLLRRAFKRELRKGKAEACLAVGESLYHQATVEKSLGAGVWWTRTQGGWKEGGDEHQAKPKPSKLTFNVLPAKSDITITTGGDSGQS